MDMRKIGLVAAVAVLLTSNPAATQEETLIVYGSGGIGLGHEPSLVLGLGVPVWSAAKWSLAIDGDAFVNRNGYLAAGLDLRSPTFVKDRIYSVAGGKISTEGLVATAGFGFLGRGDSDLAIELLIHGWDNAFGDLGLVLRKEFDR